MTDKVFADLTACFLYLVAFGSKQGKNFIPEIALYQDFPVFYRTSHTAFRFEHFTNQLQIFVPAAEAVHSAHHFAAPFSVEVDFKVLLLRRQRVLLHAAFLLVLKIGVGTVDNAGKFLFRHIDSNNACKSNLFSGVQVTVTGNYLQRCRGHVGNNFLPHHYRFAVQVHRPRVGPLYADMPPPYDL